MSNKSYSPICNHGSVGFLLGAVSFVILSPYLGHAGEIPAKEKPFEVKTVRDVSYYDGPDAHKTKHKLDLFLPKDKKDFPVLLFVHGGGWRHGDKDFLGIYSAIGNMFAEHGIGAVVINYRLSPEVMHPEHIKDVAKAFAWTYKNIATYGGQKDNIVYCPVPERMFQGVFGKDPENRKNAFPINHVREGLPPFLIVYGDRDFPGCDKMSADFAKSLKEKKDEANALEVPKRNHFSIITSLPADDDPVGKAMLDFIAAHLQSDLKAKKTDDRNPK